MAKDENDFTMIISKSEKERQMRMSGERNWKKNWIQMNGKRFYIFKMLGIKSAKYKVKSAIFKQKIERFC